ncbi:hypothetical protein EDB84DRAFT_1446801 [Lactarius hengduanensis]|nr:hypothetical protein EDB84DRAFT_1446801 [Lactarius hengduanensis]
MSYILWNIRRGKGKLKREGESPGREGSQALRERGKAAKHAGTAVLRKRARARESARRREASAAESEAWHRGTLNTHTALWPINTNLNDTDVATCTANTMIGDLAENKEGQAHEEIYENEEGEDGESKMLVLQEDQDTIQARDPRELTWGDNKGIPRRRAFPRNGWGSISQGVGTPKYMVRDGSQAETEDAWQRVVKWKDNSKK